MLIINTNNNIQYYLYLQDSINTRYTSCAIAPNGKIYSPAFGGGSHILVIDTNTNICDSTSLSFGGTQFYQSAALAPNGNIYCFPISGVNIANILIINRCEYC